MKRTPTGRFDSADFESTDTLEMPALDGDTARLSRPPMPAIAVNVADLAESLREREQRIGQIEQRVAELTALLAATEARCAGLQGECDALRDAATSAPPHGEPAGESRELAALRHRNQQLLESLATVQGQFAVRDAMLQEAEQALQEGAPASVPSFPADHEWQARCDELSSTLATERAAAAEMAARQEARLAAIEVELAAVRAQLAVAPAPLDDLPWAAQPRPVGSVLRVLVRQEGGTEVAYPLGRHTTIGRTPDNDIQVNTTFVSRQHAALLAGTDHCIIEDLNSTNGVLVNGQRIGRQVLHDGDTVTIGKTNFRYEQRS